ncbi:hypothetical protein OH76DRAFT_1111026 [Lentinus brumalis]|uniref:Uncharacterized protein n=1 Tax=Lentinus brumalis TaxID=2498619 RepID=A0A371CVA1_9APHY|nr:hypothetical protein OH76DRAFT_1111026 [Polyporus brumalis]
MLPSIAVITIIGLNNSCAAHVGKALRQALALEQRNCFDSFPPGISPRLNSLHPCDLVRAHHSLSISFALPSARPMHPRDCKDIPNLAHEVAIADTSVFVPRRTRLFAECTVRLPLSVSRVGLETQP